MADLLAQQEEEHRVILARIEEARSLGPLSPHGRERLDTTMAMFMAHLDRDEAEIFRVLEAAAQTNDSVRQALRWFAVHRTISVEAIEAACERLRRTTSELEYAQDFGHLVAIIGSRIQREESILHPIFRRLTEGKARG